MLPGSKFIPQTLGLYLPAVWSLDTGVRDVSDGWWPGALSLTVPLCAWLPAWARGLCCRTHQTKAICKRGRWPIVPISFLPPALISPLLPVAFPPPSGDSAVAVQDSWDYCCGTHLRPLHRESGQHFCRILACAGGRTPKLFLSGLPSYLCSLYPLPLLPSSPAIYSFDPEVSWPV